MEFTGYERGKGGGGRKREKDRVRAESAPKIAYRASGKAIT